MKNIAKFSSTYLFVALFALSFAGCDDDSSNNTTECSAPEDCGTATGCRSYACDEGMCITSDATAGAACSDDGGTVCDGQGSCVTNSCDTTDDCTGVADTWCDNGTCVPLKDLGAVCAAAEECASTFCADGFCCNAACDEGCDSCGLSGSEGTCTILGQGEEGDPACAPYVCDGAVAACPTSCDSSDDCIEGGYCDTALGECVGTLKATGAACDDGGECESGACVEGVCCDGTCGGGCESCLAVNTGDVDGHCSPILADTECRASAGECDVAEVCDGTNTECPADTLLNGTECRPSAGPCDVAEVCDGANPSCPADVVAPPTVECRPAAGACDFAELCDGTNAACPADVVQPATVECRPSAGPCDVAEMCDGSSGVCPADSVQPSTVECRAAVGACDIAELCDGSNAACPADVVQPSTIECRASAGGCDVAEMCDGSSGLCPADGVLSLGTECRAMAGPCDVAEVCDGINAACPADSVASSTAECRAVAGPCDVAEMCDGTHITCPADAVASSTVECRASAGPCDVAEMCNGTHVTCPADAVEPSTTMCRNASGPCDVSEYCDGSTAVCPTDAVVSAGTECRAAAGLCDLAEVCDGATKGCPVDSVEPSTTECRAATDVCDVAEFCDGSTTTCPADAVAPDTTECRAVAGSCDVAEMCDGSTKSCPVDEVVPDGVQGSPSCAPYLCDGVDAYCPGTCLSNDECEGDWWCQAETASCAYGHTIAIDGVNDFTPGDEDLPTTSGGFLGHVTWDDTYLYVGMSGIPVGDFTPFTYLLVYVSGRHFIPAIDGNLYNTQQPIMAPSAQFDTLVQWRTDGGDTIAYGSSPPDWFPGVPMDLTGGVAYNYGAGYVEMRISFMDLGIDTSMLTDVNVHMSMVNSIPGGEWTFAGVPMTSFTDGYDPDYFSYLNFMIGETIPPAIYPPMF